MKRTVVKIVAGIITISIVGIIQPKNAKAQNPPFFNPEIMQFLTDWGVLAPMTGYIQALFGYNEMLYESKKVSADDCIKLDKAIGTIASVFKKAWKKLKHKAIKKEMELTADDYMKASSLYARYHKTGNVKFKKQAEKLLKSAENHWKNVSDILDKITSGGK